MAHGCIKLSKGPWAVRRRGRYGDEKRSWRCPSEREREENRRRESRRRFITTRIFEGLRRYGNYKLRKNAGRNELLKALCEEAGWDVDDEGNISRKPQSGTEPFGSPTSRMEVEFELTLATPC
ncbi:uncharacterized protein A4U43_C08F6800 [Asparagus officinalis]|uniref:BES1/BZR1 homolog protein 4-like n=1 Tax=Asparagus officinalis TaxID=4686 RepID=UPI00098E29E4|nr:BES1/BZR1 homolog protein 4-like [Asparagus officinalis]ONK59474.1 uncharacterized protein A4U43_C08F6800 [Asparagus officinalis]